MITDQGRDGAFCLESLHLAQPNLVVGKAPVLSGVPRATLVGGAGARWSGGFVMHKDTIAQRFWTRVEKLDECWLWMGGRDAKGYGRLRWCGKHWKAHRLSFTLAYGSIPDSLHILHQCDNPPCVNPSHLYAGTEKQNALDRLQRGQHVGFTSERNPSVLYPERLARGNKHGARLHPERMARGSRQGSAKLTETDVLTIRELYVTGGRTKVCLARMFGVGRRAIRLIVLGQCWKHVGGPIVLTEHKQGRVYEIDAIEVQDAKPSL